MDTITDYINSMFRALPDSAEAQRAKSELMSTSEEKYRTLRQDGATDNEAVGRVIAEFGSIDELADELGVARVQTGPEGPLQFSDADAERYLATQRRGSWLIGGGVLAIMVGLSLLVSIGGGADSGESTAVFSTGPFGIQGQPIGLALFFVGVAIGVGMFIFAGISMTRFGDTENRGIALSPATRARFTAERLEGVTRFGLGIASGVMAIILGVAITAVTGSLLDSDGNALNPDGVPPVALFLGVGIGVMIIVVTSMRRGALDRLTSEGDFRPETRESNRLVGVVGGIYWPLTVAVYLIWSFGWDAWGTSWIIWPIAGLLFGAFAGSAQAISSGRRSR